MWYRVCIIEHKLSHFTWGRHNVFIFHSSLSEKKYIPILYILIIAGHEFLLIMRRASSYSTTLVWALRHLLALHEALSNVCTLLTVSSRCLFFSLLTQMLIIWIFKKNTELNWIVNIFWTIFTSTVLLNPVANT